jgi:hypothetical protein
LLAVLIVELANIQGNVRRFASDQAQIRAREQRAVTFGNRSEDVESSEDVVDYLSQSGGSVVDHLRMSETSRYITSSVAKDRTSIGSIISETSFEESEANASEIAETLILSSEEQ